MHTPSTARLVPPGQAPGVVREAIARGGSLCPHGLATRTIAASALVGALAPTALAQWSLTRLNPAGAMSSYALRGSGAHQAGYATVGGVDRACVWSGTAPSRVDLHPAGAARSEAHDVHGGQQVGQVHIGNWRASLWSGTAASWVNLHPASPDAIGSFANGIEAGLQVGYVIFFENQRLVSRASTWSGTAESRVDLHPAGVLSSYLVAVDAGHQVGHVEVANSIFHASVWNGTASSWVDLHPASATSSKAFGVNGGQQVGVATVGGVDHACLWNGSANSWVDLHPLSATSSEAKGALAGQQVGTSYFGNVPHAGIWTGTSGSWVDLHPPGFLESTATDIWTDGSSTFISGWGWSAGYTGLLWTRTAPSCAADLDNGTGAGSPDGAVTIDDLLYFLVAFEAGVPGVDLDDGTGTGHLDGAVTIDDLLYFLARFESGC